MISESVLLDADLWRSKFQTAKPFPHICIDNFFDDDKAKALLRDFPAFDGAAALNEFGQPSGKVTRERLSDISPFYSSVQDYLLSQQFLQQVTALTGIQDLIADPTFFGGGTHENLNGQGLDPHIDFNYLDGNKLHRRVNILLYLNEEWSEAWGGAIQLHENPRDPAADRVSSYNPIFNRAVIFETSEISWHGFPQIRLPSDRENLSRKSLSMYLYTRDRPESQKAGPHATFYVQRPLASRFTEGLVLTSSDVQELEDGYHARDVWIAEYQKKEEVLGRQVDALHRYVNDLRQSLRLPIAGFAMQGRIVSGEIYHDSWAAPFFEVELTALEDLSSCHLYIEIPDDFPSVHRTLSIGIGGQLTVVSIREHGRINFPISLQISQGSTFKFSIACDEVFNLAKAGLGADERDLAFRIDRILFT